jgi:hypothetical protein
LPPLEVQAARVSGSASPMASTLFLILNTVSLSYR